MLAYIVKSLSNYSEYLRCRIDLAEIGDHWENLFLLANADDLFKRDTGQFLVACECPQITGIGYGAHQRSESSQTLWQ